MSKWNELFDQARPAFAQQRTIGRTRGLAASGLACLGRHTVSGLLRTAGQQFVDWSAAYRLCERERPDLEGLWRVPRHDVLAALPASAPVVALIDDTLVRKRGQHINGTSWRRDPLGPHFADNFIGPAVFCRSRSPCQRCQGQPLRALAPSRSIWYILLHHENHHARHP